MRLAFYAPLKSPDHPVPSGDRAMARAVMAALEYAGATVDVASTLRSRDGAGDADMQRDIQHKATAECARLSTLGQHANWQAWITYHNYYKAPDLIGPAVAQALNIPYLQIESTRAQKRLNGPWHDFAVAAETASDAAAAIFYLTEQDAFALKRDAPKGQHLHHLRPFLSQAHLPPASTGKGAMLSVGMMRAGDKFASYQLIAETLDLLQIDNWHLNIAGDGPMRAEVERLMSSFGAHVRFLGELDQPTLARTYQTSALLLWPGVNEAFGLTYLEAQSHGLPVIAQDRPGVRDVLAPGLYPAPEHGPKALAAQVTQLLTDTDRRHRLGQAARAHVDTHHLLPAAAKTLAAGLTAVGVAP